MKSTIICFLALGAGALAAAPDASDLKQSASGQEQIRGEAQALEQRLDGILAEYTANGLASGEDYAALKSVRGVLGSLSDKEMERVVALLTDAGGSQGGTTQQAAQAYAGQKGISLGLKQILAAHEQEQDADALAGVVSQLADRQAANLSAAIDAKQLAAKDQSNNGRTAVAASQEAQQAEEQSIAGEVQLLAAKLDKVAAAAGDAKYKDAEGHLAQAQAQAAAAATAMSGGKIDDAVTAETAAREQLKQIARAIAPAVQEADTASADAGSLADIAQEQRDLAASTDEVNHSLDRAEEDQTPAGLNRALAEQLKRPRTRLAQALAQSGLGPNSPMEQIKAAPEVQKFLADRTESAQRQQAADEAKLKALAGDQAALETKAGLVKQDLDAASAAEAAPVANALADMAAAQAALGQGNVKPALEDETQAAAALDQASQMAANSGDNKPAATPAGDRQQQLQQMQKQAQQLAASEAAATQQAAAAQQAGAAAAQQAAAQQSMAAQAQNLQQAAAAAASSSAPALQQAANAMKNAAQMQAGGMPSIAQASQQAAAQDLSAAAQQLAQEAAAAAAEKQELAQLEKDMAAFARIIQEQQRVILDTDKSVDEKRLGLGRARELAHEQAAVSKDTGSLQQTVSTAAPDAAKLLDQADAAMGEAVQKLNDDAIPPAQAPEQAALALLYKAQDALSSQMQQLAQATGAQPPQAAAAAANAAAQLAQAQAQAAAAQQAMAQGQQNPGAAMPNAAAQLAQAAQGAAQAAANPEALPQQASDAMRQAQQALASAAAAAAAGQPQAAQADAAQGQSALGAAQSALAEMNSGIAPLAAMSPAAAAAMAAAAGAPGTPSTDAAEEQAWDDDGGAVSRGMAAAHGGSHFLGLPDRDRAALQQSQAEKYPQEYAGMIEGYMRKLANTSADK